MGGSLRLSRFNQVYSQVKMTLSSIDSADSLSIEKSSPQAGQKENHQTLKLEKSLENTRALIMNHRLYERISNEKQICTFMEYHIFSVWDFQSLIKSLQNLSLIHI